MAQPEQPLVPDLAAPATGITRGQWMTLLAAFLGWMFDGFEMGLFPLVARPALQDLVGPEQTDMWEGVITAGFLVGAAAGGVIFGWLGDRIGRVRAMTLSVMAYAVFSGLCGVTTNVEQLFACRFLAALGMGGEWSLGVALVMEIWPNKSRGVLAGLIGAASNVGFLLIAIFGLGLSNFIKDMHGLLTSTGLPQSWVDGLVAHGGWRLLMIIGAAPALLTFFIRLVVPESEKWLHAQDKGKTSSWAAKDLFGVLIGTCGALLIVSFWANTPWIPKTTMPVKIVGSSIGFVIALLGFIYPVMRYLQRSHAGNASAAWGPTMKNMLTGALLSGVALLGTWASLQRAPSLADKLVDKHAVANKLEGAELTKARAQARSYTQMSAGVGAIIGTMAGALLGNAIGRRITYTLLCSSSLVLALVFFQLCTVYNSMFLFCAFLAGGATASFYGWLPLYLPELFPTNVRATGQGFSFNFGRIVAAVGSLQTGNITALFQGSATHPVDGAVALANSCSVLSLIYLVGMVAIWFAPETYGKPLPE